MQPVTITTSLPKSLEYPFQDPRWGQKLLIGGSLMLATVIIPVLPAVFVSGYNARLQRHILRNGGVPTLPEWDDWSGLLNDGIRFGAIPLIYMFPVMVLSLISYLAIMIPIMGFSGSNNGEMPPLAFAALFFGFIMMGIAFLGGVCLNLMLTAATTHAIHENSFSAGFRFSAWWPIFRANIGGYLLVIFVVWIITMIMTMAMQFLVVTFILACLLPIVLGVTSVYLSWVSGALSAQAYLEGRRRAA